MKKLIRQVTVYATDRRLFLGRVSAALAAVTASVFGFGRPAAACYSEHCCSLCYEPSGSCGSCTCVWSWPCCDTASGDKYKCKECWTVAPCDSSCAYVRCSQALLNGLCNP